MTPFTKIVCAIDFSDMSRELLHYAVQLAAGSPGADLRVVHVVPDPLHEPWTVETAGIDFAQLTQDWVADANRRLSQLMVGESPTAGSAKPVVLVGRPAEEIVRYAKELHADVIVMSTHGYGPVKRFLLGSVAERVLRQAACPVLTIPHRSLREHEQARQSETPVAAKQ